jgi:hypothetical protein
MGLSPISRASCVVLLWLSVTPGCLGSVEHDAPLLRQDAPTGTAVEFEAKLERYFACRDSLEPRMRESHRDYQTVVEGAGRRLPEKTYHFGVDRSTFRTCRVALADAHVMPPARPLLESTAKAMVAVAMEYADRSRRVGRAPAGGAHPVLDGPDTRLDLDWERFEAALDGFAEQLEDERTQNDPRLLEELSTGDDLRFRTVAVIVHARPLIACLARDPSPVQGECDPWRDPFVRANATMQEVLGERANVFWSDTFRVSAAALAELVEGAFTRLGEGSLRDVDRERLRRTHADLVRDAATLRLEFF